jgi:malate dehydrogenase
MNRKVTVVGGAGNVGATVARAIANQELADVVLIDIAETKAQGVALDIFQACPIEGSDSRVIGGSDFADSAGSEVVVITSGVPRKPGMSRDDLLLTNFRIMQQVTEQIVKHSPNCIIVPVANPLDAMCWAVHKLSGFPRERVIGMAGILDSARMRTFIAMELNVSVENVHAAVLGGHGDTMVPLPRYSTVAGVPLPELLSAERIAAIAKRTADGGAEITKLVGTRPCGRGNGRLHRQRQEEDRALLGLSAGRVRHPRPVRRRACETRRRRRRADHRSETERGGESGAR